MRYEMIFATCLTGAAFGSGALAAELTSAELESALATISTGCTQQHGYDPAKPGDVGEHELAPNEKAWRECLYAGIRADLAARSSMPEMYERVIMQDIKFTAAIETGQMTRFERWQRNRTSKQLIVANEAIVQSADVERGQKQLDNFQEQQMEMLLRVTPPQMPRFR